MDNGTLVATEGRAPAPTLRLRASAVIVGVALVFAALVLVQHRADAAPVTVAAAVARPAASALTPQINFGQFACPILLSVRASFANSPFFAIVVAALRPFLIAFGCLPSGG